MLEQAQANSAKLGRSVQNNKTFQEELLRAKLQAKAGGPGKKVERMVADALKEEEKRNAIVNQHKGSQASALEKKLARIAVG